MKKITCDILVVGGGGGGLRAALAAVEENPKLKVVLATKGALGKSGVTALACSDRMAFHATLGHTEPQEEGSWKHHAKDIYEIGGKVSDGSLAEILARQAEDAFNYLDHLGVPFVKRNGLADQFITDGSDFPRACYTGPKTAVHIEEALVKELKTKNIEVIEYCMVAKLLTDKNSVVGAIALDTREDELTKTLFL
ncbi:MAG: FAD-binding protein, partial [Bacillota bacterium]|nr:FAD-binding protein [Bacillota bacterium]